MPTAQARSAMKDDLFGLPGDGLHWAWQRCGRYEYQKVLMQSTTDKYPLNDLVAVASGAAYQATVIQTVDQAPRTSGWYLDVHLGSSAQVLQNDQPTLYSEPIICGNIGKSVSLS